MPCSETVSAKTNSPAAAMVIQYAARRRSQPPMPPCVGMVTSLSAIGASPSSRARM